MDVSLKGQRNILDNSADNGHKFSINKYMQNGHIHGLKYLTQNGKFETFFWTITILISSLLAGIFVAKALSVSSVRDLMIQANLPPKPLSSLPFPSITICAETKARKTIVNFTEAYHYFKRDSNSTNGDESQLSDEEVSMVEALTQICDSHLLEDSELKNPPTPGRELLDIHRKVSLEQDFLVFCRFQGDMRPCSGLFEETVTDDGICYTFNRLRNQDMYKSDDESESPWNLRSGYDNVENISNPYPHRAMAGTELGLNVVLMMPTSNLDFLCKGPVQGYKVRIHAPDEHPRMENGYQRIGLNSESLIEATPEVFLNQENQGANYHSTSTKNLKYFKAYSHANCISECISAYVALHCGCVKFTMVHDNSSNICSQHDTNCVSKAMKKFSSDHMNEFPCDCKPTCDSLKYKTKVTQAEFSFKNTFAAYEEDPEDEFPKTAMSRLVVYMDEDFYVPSTYVPATDSPFEHIAKIGGVLAFFLGASWISFIEIMFYGVRRMLCP